MGATNAVIPALARLYPYEVEVSDDLAESLSFIESSHDPETVVRAGFGAGMVAIFLSFALLFGLAPLPWFYAVFFAVVIGLGTVEAVHSGPDVLAAFRRTRALGDTPNLIGRAVLRMEIQPATETAVRFAAETGQGPLAKSLGDHIDRSIGTPRTGLLSFADEWSAYFPALRRSAHLLSTAENAPEAERVRTLERSLMAILDGTREQMAEFTTAIRGPTTALYAFGVMLPLALVALVPAAGFAEIGLSIGVFVVLYNVALPAMLIAASVWLLVRRPVAFPPPDVRRDHPDVPDRVWLPLLLGPIAGAVAYAPTRLFGPAYLAPIAGVGVALGVTLLAYFRPIMLVRAHVREVEEHLTDALYLVGRQVSEGEAVEAAIELAGERVPAETGAVFERAAGVQRRLKVGVEEAFFGEYGALQDVPSARAHGTASLLGIAADEGRPAGRAIVSMADHLEELQEVESEAKRQLAMVTGTLENTAAFFGPLVAGATVALAHGMTGEDGLGQAEVQTVPPEQLGVVVGLYVVTMAVVLTTLSVGLRHGLDRSLVGYTVGRSLVLAVPLYVITVRFVGLLI